MSSETTQSQTAFYRYPPRGLLGDYVRSAVGLALGIALLAGSEGSPWVLAISTTLVLAFGAFGLRTLRQQITQVAINPQGVFTKTMGTRALAWEEIEGLKLRFFGSRRERRRSEGGFLQLTLAGGGKKLSFESGLEGFEDIAWHAARAARHNGVALDPTTAGNLIGIGIHPDEDTPRPDGRIELRPGAGSSA